jgi:hypothetical protein
MHDLDAGTDQHLLGAILSEVTALPGGAAGSLRWFPPGDARNRLPYSIKWPGEIWKIDQRQQQCGYPEDIFVGEHCK